MATGIVLQLVGVLGVSPLKASSSGKKGSPEHQPGSTGAERRTAGASLSPFPLLSPFSPCHQAPALGRVLSLTYLLHTIMMTTTAMRNTSPAAEEPMMSGSFSWTLVWYSAGTQGRGNGLLQHRMGLHNQVHQDQSLALSTAHICTAIADGLPDTVLAQDSPCCPRYGSG